MNFRQNHIIPFFILIVFIVPNISVADEDMCLSVTYTAPSEVKNNIIYTFDKYYSCGKFLNGDWWVSPDKSGFIIIKNVSPVSENKKNGLEINPTSQEKQGFDDRISGYSESLNLKLPLRVYPESSVIKSVSVSTKSKCRPCLQFSAVLTVIKKPILESENLFRPAYFGKRKVFFSFSKSSIELPKYSKFCCNKIKNIKFKNIADNYQGLRLDHLRGWVGRKLHPIDNMPDYGASIAVQNSVSILRFLLSDFSIDLKNHRQALINYLQMAIDLQGIAYEGMRWKGAGGHGNGRKLPLLFAAHLLDKKEFYDVIKRTSFSEDEQVYYSKIAGRALFGAQCSDKDYWLTIRVRRGPRDCRDPYGYIDGGGHEIGSAYQFCCTAMPWKYTALAVRLLKLEKKWDNDHFLNYVDRWVRQGAWARPDPCAPYNNNPTDYLKLYGAKKLTKECISGTGRYMDKHGININDGHYQNDFGNQMWDSYRWKL